MQEELRERFTSSQPEQTDEEPAAEESTVPESTVPVVEEEPSVPAIEESMIEEPEAGVVELLPKGLTSIQLKVLQRIGVNTIGDFLALSEEQIGNLDVLTVRQKSKLLSLQGEVATPHSSAGEELTFHSTPDEETMVAPPVDEKSVKDDVLLSKLGLPRRVKETIHEIGAYTLGDFMKLTEDDILNTQGISQVRLRRAVQAQRELKAKTTSISSEEGATSETAATSEEAAPSEEPAPSEEVTPSEETIPSEADINSYLLSHDIPAGDADLISSIVRNASSGRNVYNELRKAFKKDWKRYYDVVKIHLAQKGEK